jgi:Domain of unknown function (DUF4276)
MCFLAPIVEGHGEVEAVPALLHRIARDTAFQGVLRVNPPIRVKAGSFLHDQDYFHKQILLASAKAAQEIGSVLILLDCDDGCPADIGPELLRKAREVRSDVNILMSLAYREYETWFITAAPSLAGMRGLPPNSQPPEDPEGIRDAKGWLGERMEIPYDPVTHQIEFTRKFDLHQARSNQSFERMYRIVDSVLRSALRLPGCN